MPTTVTEIPGFNQVAMGNNIQTVGTEYHVANITPYPNGDLIVGNTYNIADAAVTINAVELTSAPGGGMRTAIFKRQT